eukprot:1103362-Prorocentrum_minimum.AAC.1
MARGGFRGARVGFRGARGGFRMARGGLRDARGGFRGARGGFRMARGGFRMARGGFRGARGGFRARGADSRAPFNSRSALHRFPMCTTGPRGGGRTPTLGVGSRGNIGSWCRSQVRTALSMTSVSAAPAVSLPPPMLACAEKLLQSLPPPFDRWGDQERMLVNIWVEMQHLNATHHNTNFRVGPADKVTQLLRMGQYLVRQQLGNK